MSYQVINPLIQFVDPVNGKPLSAGSVYFGRMDSDPKNQPSNRINVYAVQDNGSEVLLSQPIELNSAGQPQYSGSVKQLKVETYTGENAYCVQAFSRTGVQKSYTSRVYSLVDSESLAAPDSTQVIGGESAANIGSSVHEILRKSVFAPLLTSNSAAQNTGILQAKIDYANSLYAENAGFGNGSVIVEMPAGSFDYEGVEIKKGVSIAGAGVGQTLLFLTGNNKTGFYNKASVTQSYVDQVSYGSIGGFSVAPKSPSSTTGQVMIDAVGFSRWKFYDLFIGWCSGVTGIRMTGATTAGDGGSAQWYNLFENVFVERASAWPSGGVGWELGDTAADKEQVTTWTIIGGRTNGSGAGTGINIQSCNTILFSNHIIEGCDVYIGNDAAARKPVNVVFSPLYLEGSASNNFRISSVAEDTAIFGQFITGYTVTDNSSTTQRHAKDNFKSFCAKSSLSEWLVNIEDATIKRPQFKAVSGYAGLDLVRGDGVEVTIENASQLSSAEAFFRVLWNNRANVIFSVGNAAMKAGNASGDVTLGTASHLFGQIYSALPTYADNAAAIAAGHSAGAFYKTAAGNVQVVV